MSIALLIPMAIWTLAQPPGEPPLRRVPAEDSCAHIVEVFDDGQLLLSAGSDSGFAKGDQIQVYRLGGNPTYVGVAKITSIGPNHSLARVDKLAPRQKPRTGDDVAKPVTPAGPDQGSVPKLHGGAIIDKRPPG